MTTGPLDALLLVLKAVPIYPPGHQRVQGALQRFQEELKLAETRGEHLLVGVVGNGLLFQDEVLDMRGTGRKELREALVATGVADLAIWGDVTDQALLELSLRLNRNVRAAAQSHVAFEDLWGDPIEGVTVGEQVYYESGMSEIDGLLAGESGHSPDGGQGQGGDGASGDPASAQVGSFKRLRRLTLGCPRTRTLLRQIAGVLRESARAGAGETTDLLDHILALLPAEARRSPLQGLQAVEKTLEAFLAELKALPPDAAAANSDAVLAQTVAHLFPSAAGKEAPAAESENPDAGLPPTPLTLQREREVAMGEDLPLLEREVSVGAGGPGLTFADETGRGEYGWILIDALATASPDRREPIRRRLVAHLKERKEATDLAEIGKRMKNAADPLERDKAPGLMRELASVLSEANLDDVAAASLSLDAEVVARTLPHLLRAYLITAHGRAGSVCRIAGRDAILKDGASLLVTGGALHGQGVDVVLAERSLDALPMWEVLLRYGSPEIRGRAARALRALTLPSVAALVLKVCPPDRLSTDFLCGICEEGFDGKDAHRWDRMAVSALETVIDAQPAGADAGTVPHAISTLRYFDTALAAPVANRLLKRRGLFHAYPRAIRKFAKAVLVHREHVDRAPPGTGPEFGP